MILVVPLIPRFHERLGIWSPNAGMAWLPDLSVSKEEGWRGRVGVLPLGSWSEQGPRS